jgi:SOS response regulatory protein OraA/RecX
MDDIRDTAMRLLANRMKTAKQLGESLRTKGYSDEEIDPLLTEFKEYGYLNDREYAAVYISHNLPKGKTVWLLSRELGEKGISQEHFQAGLQQFIEENNIDPAADELERAKGIAYKIFLDKTPIDNKLIAKAGRKLASLGYRSETIYRVLGELTRGKE